MLCISLLVYFSLLGYSIMAFILITHDLGIVAERSHRTAIMYAGKIVEEGLADEVFDTPKHPYTVGLLRSLPRRGIHKTQNALSTIPGSLPVLGTELARVSSAGLDLAEGFAFARAQGGTGNETIVANAASASGGFHHTRFPASAASTRAAL